jgi:aldehyde dehydrogenase family 7 protein A1
MPGNFVQPTIFEIGKDAQILQQELFVPILYMVRFSTFEEAVQINNSVP